MKTTVVEQYMQRSPVFMFAEVARRQRIGHWVSSHDQLGRNRP